MVTRGAKVQRFIADDQLPLPPRLVREAAARYVSVLLSGRPGHR